MRSRPGIATSPACTRSRRSDPGPSSVSSRPRPCTGCLCSASHETSTSSTPRPRDRRHSATSSCTRARRRARWDASTISTWSTAPTPSSISPVFSLPRLPSRRSTRPLRRATLHLLRSRRSWTGSQGGRSVGAGRAAPGGRSSGRTHERSPSARASAAPSSTGSATRRPRSSTRSGSRAPRTVSTSSGRRKGSSASRTGTANTRRMPWHPSLARSAVRIAFADT